jgi:hypothetical protein
MVFNHFLTEGFDFRVLRFGSRHFSEFDFRHTAGRGVVHKRQIAAGNNRIAFVARRFRRFALTIGALFAVSLPGSFEQAAPIAVKKTADINKIPIFIRSFSIAFSCC